MLALPMLTEISALSNELSLVDPDIVASANLENLCALFDREGVSLGDFEDVSLDELRENIFKIEVIHEFMSRYHDFVDDEDSDEFEIIRRRMVKVYEILHRISTPKVIVEECGYNNPNEIIANILKLQSIGVHDLVGKIVQFTDCAWAAIHGSDNETMKAQLVERYEVVPVWDDDDEFEIVDGEMCVSREVIQKYRDMYREMSELVDESVENAMESMLLTMQEYEDLRVNILETLGLPSDSDDLILRNFLIGYGEQTAHNMLEENKHTHIANSTIVSGEFHEIVRDILEAVYYDEDDMAIVTRG